MPDPLYLLPFLFPVVFIGFWLIITSVLGKMSGWFFLQDAYPDHEEEPLVRLRFQSGSMGGRWGMPVNFNGCMRFDVCPTGLRISVWRTFGLFQKPFFVPWRDITAEEKRVLMFRMVRLRFAGWPEGELAMRQGTFDRIAAQSPLRMPVA